MTAAPEPSTSSPLGAMTGFLFAAGAMFATMYSTQAILPEIGRAFSVSPSRAGLTVSVLVLSLVIGSWVWGPLSDRAGRRKCLIVASALLVPASIAVALAPTFGALLACRVVQGLIMPGLLVVGLPYVSEVFVPMIGARAVGWYMGSLIAGGLIGRLGVAQLAGLTDWRFALGAVAIFPAVAVVVMVRKLPEAPPAHRDGRRGRIANRRVWAASMTGPSAFFAFVGVYSYISYRLEADPFGLSPIVGSWVFAIWTVGVVAPMAGRWAEHAGWGTVALAGVVAMLGGVALALADWLPSIVLGLILVTGGMFTVVTAAPIGVGGAVGVRPGAASALYYSLYYTAGSLGAFLPGLAWEATGWAGVSGVVAVALTVGLVGALLGRAGHRRVVGRDATAGWPA